MVYFIKNGKDVVRPKVGILEISPLTTQKGEFTKIKLVNNEIIYVENSFADVIETLKGDKQHVLLEVSNPKYEPFVV